MFTAKETQSPKWILVKVVRRYGRVVHELLAEHRFAPALYGCQDVLEGLEWTTTATEHPGRTGCRRLQKAPNK